MKMIAIARLKRAQESLHSFNEYEKMLGLMTRQVAAVCRQREIPLSDIAKGRGSAETKTVLLVVYSSNRGLCGGFNGAVIRTAKAAVARLRAEGKEVKFLFIGEKGKNILKKIFPGQELEFEISADNQHASEQLAAFFKDLYMSRKVDQVRLIFNLFKSTISQTPTSEDIIPLAAVSDENADAAAVLDTDDIVADSDYEPDLRHLTAMLEDAYLASRILGAWLNSQAAEHGSRMTSMDAATRNAGKMIDSLTLRYNRTRQSIITTELTEIIAGAEALN